MTNLQAKRLLDQTLVVLGTEFGHTPRINANDWRDHHSKALTCLLAGAGIEDREAKVDTHSDNVEGTPVRRRP